MSGGVDSAIPITSLLQGICCEPRDAATRPHPITNAPLLMDTSPLARVPADRASALRLEVKCLPELLRRPPSF